MRLNRIRGWPIALGLFALGNMRPRVRARVRSFMRVFWPTERSGLFTVLPVSRPPLVVTVTGNASNFHPTSFLQLHLVICQGTISIECLFRLCRPFTIARFIVAIIIHSFQSVLWSWLLTHIFKKVFKSKPTLTHSDTSTSVSVVPFMALIEDSIIHCHP